MSARAVSGRAVGRSAVRDWRAPLSIAAMGTIGMALAAAGATGGVRAWTTTAFLLTGPGLAVAGRFDLGDPGLEVATSIATSVAIGTIVAMVMVTGGWWNPNAAYLAVGVPSVAALCELSYRRRARAAKREVRT